MSTQAIIVLVIAGLALILFVTEWVAADLVALLVLISLGLTGILDLPTLFAGFGSPVILTLIGIFMLTSALHHTGVTAYLARLLLRIARRLDDRWLPGVLAAFASLTSLFTNTVAAVAIVAPISRQVSLKRNISPSRLMMPISFGALLGGMATLLTTANLLVAGLLSDQGLRTFNLLSFLPVGGPIALAGLLYLALFSRRLLPERAPTDQWSGLQQARQELAKTYRLSLRLHEAYIRDGCSLIGATLAESNLGHTYGVTISAVVRGRKTFAPPPPEMRLEVDDWLLLQGRPNEVETLHNELGLDIFDYDQTGQAILFSAESELAEIAISPRSRVIGSTLSQIRFRDRYGLNVLAIWHEGRPIRSFLSEHVFEGGDAVLVQGEPRRLELLARDADFLVLSHLPEVPDHPERAAIALGTLILFLVAIVFNWIAVPLAALLGAVLVVVTGCETIEQARESIQWQVIFMIGGMLPLARALDQTGAVSIFIQALVGVQDVLGPRGLLLIFYLMTMALSQFTSGQAATLIVGPLALATGLHLGLGPQALMMGVALGASTGFLSPISHPANLLVMGPGGYRFSDYSRLGLPLVVIVMVGVVALLPLIYPL